MQKARLFTLYFCCISLFLFSFVSPAQAELKPDDIPEPLKPWVPWVLNDAKTDCPHWYNREQRACAWPSQLKLLLRADGGQFSQQWQVFTETLVQLPGDSKVWPQAVTLNDNALLVEQKNGYPYIRLTKGLHTIKGHFQWQQLPRTLTVTPEVGLVDLTIAGKAVAYPRFSQPGQLWLTDHEVQQSDKDDLDIQVFRKITDGHPIQTTTRIKLRVSGKQRNTLLTPILPENFIPLRIDSKLPARMQGQQQLQVQLRPGEWTLDIIGRAPGDQTQFTLPKSQAPWPQQEVWVFQPAPDVRQVQITQPGSIDPQQTRLPNAWKQLSAYLLKPGESLQLEVLQRGVVTSKKNPLRLERTAWLDYDGQGYTFKDQLSGTSPESNRLEVIPEIALGRVRVNQQAQLITQLNEDAPAGVELRDTRLNLQAESRYDGSRSELPINGWQHDMEAVNTKINIPAGWLLLAVSGVDSNSPNSWLQQWSLLDLFFVLLIALAVGYLYNPLWTALALLALAFTWHETGAPRLIWINLLAVIALLRVTPAGKLKNWLAYYRGVSFILLVIILLPYMIAQVKIGLYPQLNSFSHSSSNTRDSHSNFDTGAGINEQSRVMTQTALLEAPMMQQDMVEPNNTPSSSSAPRIPSNGKYKKEAYDFSRSQKRIERLQSIDPDNQIQTGPGLPNWQGNTLHLQWEGPIKADETSRLWLLSPIFNFWFKVLGILLLLGLSWRLINPSDSNAGAGFSLPSLQKYTPEFAKRWLPVLAICLGALVLTPPPVQANDFPGPSLLQELKKRLVSKAKCLPQCAQIENMHVLLSNNTLFIRLQVHAASHSAFPLPGSQNTWLPETVLLNHQPAKSLQRDSQQKLWLSVDKGIHTVLLQGALPKRQTLNIPFPLKPHYTHWQSQDSNWSLEGINPNGIIPNTSIQLIRTSTKNEDSQQWEQASLPAFVEVERYLQLGLDWHVETRVRRLSPANTPLTLSIPLLSNEQPMSESLIIKQRQIQITLASGQTETSWSSRLPIRDKLLLQATTRNDYFERWLVASSPRWHVQSSGLPISEYSQLAGQRIPIWKPWPDEKLELNITRPQGIIGPMITVQNSAVEINTGNRANDVNLTLDILSSRGNQYALNLPAGTDLQEITIDGIKQQLPQSPEQNTIDLTLKPSQQTVAIKWRETEPLGLFYRFPSIDLQQDSVNSRLSISSMSDRWVLWASGPETGPVILFWGVLLVLFFISLALGYSGLTPLKAWQWFLLAIGLSQTQSLLMILIVSWLIAIAAREKLTHTQIHSLKSWQFNYGIQVGLVSLSFIALLALIGAVANGLLGHPEMQIAGNGSSSYALNWYQDRNTPELPQPFIISVPLWIYRTLMLLWALWLASAVLAWLRWGWQALNQGELWIPKPKSKKT